MLPYRQMGELRLVWGRHSDIDHTWSLLYSTMVLYDNANHFDRDAIIIVVSLVVIKTHGSVSCGPRSRHATPASILTGRTKMQFSRIRNFMLLVQNRMIFAVEMPSTVSTPHSKFQLNCARSFRDMNFQKLA